MPTAAELKIQLAAERLARRQREEEAEAAALLAIEEAELAERRAEEERRRVEEERKRVEEEKRRAEEERRREAERIREQQTTSIRVTAARPKSKTPLASGSGDAKLDITTVPTACWYCRTKEKQCTWIA
jgi:hypothetical protein